MSCETLAIDIWLESLLATNETLISLLGDSFSNSTTVKRLTYYQSGNSLYVPMDGTGFVYKVISGGRTDSSEPIFPTGALSTVVDGSVTWQQAGPIALRPRIFQGVAPATAQEPFIVYNLHVPKTTQRVGMGGSDIFGSYTYQIRATDRGSDKTLVAEIADAIDNALNIGENNSGPLINFNGSNYQIVGCYRDVPIDLQEFQDDNRFLHVGGMYPILVQLVED